MIGIIEKVIVDCLIEVGGGDIVGEVFVAAGIPADRIYRMDRHYDDAETAKLLSATLTHTGVTDTQFYDLFSRVFFDVVEDVFPEFMRMATCSEDLVRKQVKIHALIAAGSRKPGESQKSVDKFHLEDRGPHDIVVRYKSDLQMCGLYTALVYHAADRFGDRVHIAPHICAHEGAPACSIAVKWTSIAGAPTHFHDTLDTQAQPKVAHG